MFKLLNPFWFVKALTFYMGGDPAPATSTTTANYTPEEAAARAKVQTAAQGLYDQNSAQIANSPYPGSQVAPLSADTLTGQNLAKAGANTVASQYIPQLNQATKFGLSDVLDPNSNAALKSTIDATIRPITQSYTDPNGVMSNIRTESINNGGQGTNTRQGIAEGVAAGRYANAIGDAASKVTTDAYGKGLDTFSKIYGLAPSAASVTAMPASMYGAVGAQNEAQQQAQNDYLGASRDYALNAQWTPLQNWANIVYGGTGPNSTTTTGTPAGSSSGGIQGALGGAAAGMSVAGPWGALGGAILGGLF